MYRSEELALILDGHWYSFSEVVTGSLLGIHEALRDRESGADFARALSIADDLFAFLEVKGIDLDAESFPAVGLPKPLIGDLCGADGALYKLYDEAESRGLPESVRYFLIGLEDILPKILPSPRIDLAKLPKQARLAARSSDQDTPLDIHTVQLSEAVLRRLRRVDIPVVDDADGGLEWALYAADLSFEAAPIRMIDWPGYSGDEEILSSRVSSRSFETGVQRGFEAAARLLRRLGFGPPEGKPRLVMKNVVPPALLTGGSVALPVAVETLRRVLELDPPLCAVSGEMDQNYRVLPIDADGARYAEGKLSAVLEEGSYDRLVAVTNQDLGLPGLDAIIAEGASLDEVAVRLWGADYTRKVEAAIEQALHEVGLAYGWQDGAMPTTDDVFVRTDKAASLATQIIETPEPTVWHIGGPARSGKTWIAYDVAERLEATGTWSIQVVRFVSDETDPISLTSGIKMASARLGKTSGAAANHLIVVDGLTYNEGLHALTKTVSSMLGELRAHLLLVRQSDISSDWDPPGGADIQSFFTVEDIADFVDALSQQYAEMLAKRGATPEALRQDYAGSIGDAAHHRGLTADLFWICEYARTGYRIEDYRAWLMSEVEEREIESLQRLAYATLYGINCEEELCDTLSIETRKRFQVIRTSDGLLRIAHRIAAQMALWDPNTAGNDFDHLEQGRGAESILPIIAHVISPPKDSVLARRPAKARRLTAIIRELGASWKTTLKIIFRGDRIDDKWLEARLSKSYPTEFARMFEGAFIDKPWDLAQLILTLGGSLQTRDRLRLLSNMVHSMVSEANVRNLEFSCQRLLLCYRVVEEHQLDFLEATFISAADADKRAEILALQNKVSQQWSAYLHVLARNSVTYRVFQLEKDPFQRLRVFERMLNLHMSEMIGEAVSVFPELKKGMHALGDRKYSYLRSMLDLIGITVSSNAFVKEDEVLREEFTEAESQIKGISLQECQRAYRDRNLGKMWVFAEWACLMLKVEGFNLNDDVGNLTEIFDDLAEMSSARDTIAALGAIYNQLPPATTNIVANSRLFRDASFVSDGSSATLSDIADVLFAMQRWNISAAQKILYMQGSSAKPNESLANYLARRVKAEGDLRNAGRILRAAGQLDKIVVTDLGNGFGARLLAHIGKDWIVDRVRRENRSALIYFILQGLVQIGHEWLDDVRGDILDHLKNAVADRRFQKWSASLCVFLLTDETAAPVFADPIIEGGTFARSDIRDGMESASNIEALEAYHMLGRMLPGIGSDFVREVHLEAFADDLAQSLAAPRNGEQALRAIRAVGATYREFDPEKAATFFKQFSWTTQRAALRAATFGSAASALTLLSELDREETIGLIESRAGAEILRFKLNLALRTPEAVAEIIHACEKIKRGLGRTVLARQPPIYRSILLARLRALQNPRSYAMSANLLELAWPGIGDHTSTFFRVWAHDIANIRSPAALVEILMLLEKLMQQGKSKALPRVAESIDAQKIARRLSSHRQIEDLSFAPALAMMLHQSGEIKRSALLRESLFNTTGIENIVPEHVFFDLVMLAEQTGDRAPASLIDRIDGLLRERGRRKWQLDPVRFWRAFGAYGLARKLHLGESWAVFDRPPETLQVPFDPATRILATAGLLRLPWVVRHSDSAWEEIRSQPKIVSREMRPLIVALTGHRTEIAKKLEAIAPESNALLQIPPFSLSRSRQLSEIAKQTVAQL